MTNKNWFGLFLLFAIFAFGGLTLAMAAGNNTSISANNLNKAAVSPSIKATEGITKNKTPITNAVKETTNNKAPIKEEAVKDNKETTSNGVSGGHATKTAAMDNGTTTEETTGARICKGDLNRDELLNSFDIDPFRMVFDHADWFEQNQPDMFWQADIDNDGIVNGRDISPFVKLLMGGKIVNETCRMATDN